MAFNSLQYGAFFALVLVAYWRLPHRWQNRLLLVASYVFYGAWDYRFLSLLLISTVVDFSVGRRLDATGNETRRKQLLLISIVVNLGILATFKYMGFFIDSATRFLDGIGLDVDPTVVRFTLPVGISFYTFQTMSYTIDVYRRRIAACDDRTAFALYVAFFPQLVAGPIERARHLLPRITSPRTRPNFALAGSAVRLILLGLFKKVVIADGIAPYVDRAFTSPDIYSWISLAVGALGFGLQIYGDFSGYTDIARGSARLLGIDLVRNFRQPYLSRNITEFWRRWHVSLSNWLRDYLYIPLGGNRRGPTRTYINLMITMVLGGLWHGASWTFVAWGFGHGAALALHRLWLGQREAKSDAELTMRNTGAIIGTLTLVTLLWIPFRAGDLGDAFDFIRGIVTLQGGLIDGDALILVMVFSAVLLFLDLLARGAYQRVRATPAARGLGYATAVLLIVVFSGGTEFVPFIYFQF